jgi:hypothetical protein
MIIKFNLFGIEEKSGESAKSGKPYRMVIVKGMACLSPSLKNSCFQELELAFSDADLLLIRGTSLTSYWIAISVVTGIFRGALSARASLVSLVDLEAYSEATSYDKDVLL